MSFSDIRSFKVFWSMIAPTRKITVVALMVSGLAWAQDEIPNADEYAWQFPIEIAESARFFEAQIPLGVYRSVGDPMLRDLGVYDANGMPIPRIVQHRSDDGETETIIPLGFIPMHGDDEHQRPRAYIADLRENRDSMFSELEFDWGEIYEGFIGSLIIEQSNDRQQWSPVTRGSLAQLEFEGTRISRKRIELPPQLQDFVRITWSGMPGNWQPNSVAAIGHESQAHIYRNWMTITPSMQSEDGRELIFSIGGFLPIDRVGLELTGQNVVVRAAIEFRETAIDEWQHAAEDIFFSVSDSGTRASSKPLSPGKIRAGYWRVRILSEQPDGDIQLRLGWLPGRILFLGQGEPPYTLASGRVRDAAESFPQHRIMSDSSPFTELMETTDPGMATIGLRSEAAGLSMLQDSRLKTRKTLLTWATLISATAFIALLVYSLKRKAWKKPKEN